ncbi:MAG TPA: copper resistance protein B [Edaphobacter sp.]|nr:copper resistance protein B [Edaphobacter sp.]
MSTYTNLRSRFGLPVCVWTVFGLMAPLGIANARAQTEAATANEPLVAQVAGPQLPEAPDAAGLKPPGALAWKPPVRDNRIYAHVLFNQLEGRTSGSGSALRWDGQGWVGTDMNRLWVKSEGFVNGSTVSDSDHEVLYDRPLPRMRYFDAQVGVREDLDSGPSRTWGAVGIQGLAPNFFEFSPTFYFSDGGNVGGRLEGSYDLRVTQRLVVQPQAELNFYNKSDPERGTGSGLSDLDAGVRLRYAISRKFAPYLGFAYTGKYGDAASFARQAEDAVDSPTFVFGIRIWR